VKVWLCHEHRVTVGSAIRATPGGGTAAGCDPARPRGARAPWREFRRVLEEIADRIGDYILEGLL